MNAWTWIGMTGVLASIGVRSQPAAPENPRPVSELEAKLLNEAAVHFEIQTALDAFHEAAAESDSATYVGLMSREFVFLGTDATERWERAAFIEFLTPYFDSGKGWTYEPRDRKIVLGPVEGVAWFDELLDNEKLGECRGSGVVVIEDGAWKIAQYNLSIPIPNALAEEFAEKIRGQ